MSAGGKETRKKTAEDKTAVRVPHSKSVEGEARVRKKKRKINRTKKRYRPRERALRSNSHSVACLGSQLPVGGEKKKSARNGKRWYATGRTERKRKGGELKKNQTQPTGTNHPLRGDRKDGG